MNPLPTAGKRCIVFRDRHHHWERVPIAKADEWAERIAAQQRSGISVKAVLQRTRADRHIPSTAWRKRLKKKSRYVSLWWIEEWTAGVGDGGPLDWCWRASVAHRAGVDATTLRTVVEALRR